MIIWGLLTSAFITRLIRFPHSVLAEVRHPVLSSFVSLFPATTMLVAIGFVPWFRPLAVCLFSFGVVVQLAYAAGKLRDYGADLTLKKLLRWTVSADSCQQLYQRNGLWCVGLHRRRSGVFRRRRFLMAKP